MSQKTTLSIEAAIHQYLQKIPDYGFVFLNSKNEILHISKNCSLLFAHNLEDFLGKPFLFLVHDLFKSRIDEAFNNGKHGDVEVENVLLGLNGGTYFPANVYIDFKQSVVYGGPMLVIKDVTQKIQLSEALNASEKTLESVISAAVDGIITIDLKGNVTSMNPSASKLFGYEPNEVIGSNVKILMPEPDRSMHDKYIDNYHQTKKPKIIGIGREVTGRKKDGTLFPFALGVSEVKLPNSRFYTGIIHDLTASKLSEEKLRRTMDELKQSNTELEHFASVSSHDLQEPLRKIQAFGDRIKIKDYNNLSDQSKDYLLRMLNAASRMQTLINDLLAFSRVSSKSKAFEKVDLNEILMEVISDLEIAIEKSKAKIELEKLPSIQADKTQMRQLFQNIIQNAIKFQPEGQQPIIKISASTTTKNKHLTATPGDEFTYVSIKDNGIGFKEDYAKQIFNIFQRLEGKRFEGSGIGLSVCQRIANRHGGQIIVESAPGKGSNFIIKLATKQTN